MLVHSKCHIKWHISQRKFTCLLLTSGFQQFKFGIIQTHLNECRDQPVITTHPQNPHCTVFKVSRSPSKHGRQKTWPQGKHRGFSMYMNFCKQNPQLNSSSWWSSLSIFISVEAIYLRLYAAKCCKLYKARTLLSSFYS